MDLAMALPYAVFGGIACGVWALLSQLGGKENKALKRLDEIRNPGARKDRAAGEGGMGQMLQKAAPALSKVLEPKTDLEKSALKLRLANCGFNSPHAADLYLALKVASLILGLCIGASIGLPVWGLTAKAMYALVISGGLGFYIPEAVLWFLKRRRQEKLFLSLPDALDLLVVCVEAGLGLDAGMRRVADELKDSAPELCAELQMANAAMNIGRPRREVLHDLGIRSGVDDLRALAAILIQAERFGSSIAQALRVQSDSMRVKRSQLAEEKAAKTAVKMIFPLVLFIFPGIFVVLVGPAAIQMINKLLVVH